MNDEHEADDEEPLAMKRADEAMYIQEAVDAPAEPDPGDVAEPVTVLGIVDDDAAPERPAAGELFRLVAAVFALVAVSALFYPAFSDLVASEGDTVALPEPPPPPPPEPGDTVKVVMLVDSKPSGASVTVGEIDRGGTPAVFNLDCQLGTPVRARIELEGYRPVTTDVVCAVGDPAGLRVKVRLHRK